MFLSYDSVKISLYLLNLSSRKTLNRTFTTNIGIPFILRVCYLLSLSSSSVKIEEIITEMEYQLNIVFPNENDVNSFIVLF